MCRYCTVSSPAVEQPNRSFALARRQVHVLHRRRQVLMAREVLNRLRRCSSHREVRAERVAKDVDLARCTKARSALRALHPGAERVAGHRPAVVKRQHKVAAKMAILRQRLKKGFRHRHDATVSSFRGVDDALPVGLLDAKLASTKVDVALSKCADFSAP
jgi:hypothetical protein